MTGTSHPEDKYQNLSLGLTIALAEIVLMIGISVMVKQLSSDLSTVAILMFRYIFCLPLLVFTAVLERGRKALFVSQFKALIMRIAAGLASLSCFYAALDILSLAKVTVLLQMITVFITFLAPFLLGEYIGKRRWLAVLFGFGGVFILLNPGPSEWSFVGFILGLGAPFFGAVMMIMLRKLGQSDNPASTAIWYNVTGAILFTIIFWWQGEFFPNSSFDLMILFMVGVLSSFQQYFIAFSHRLAPASFLAPFRYLSVPIGIAAGVIFFDERITTAIIFGSAVIILSSCFILWREKNIKS